MSGGGGGSGNDGSNDMQVSGMEAAMSTEKGISTHAESKVGGNQGNINDEFGSGGNVYDNSPDTSTVGMASDSKDYFSSPQNPPGVSTAFDYETEAYKGDVNIDAGYGQGKITSAVYDAKTGKTNIEQTVGIIDTATYQTANLQAYLDSPDVSDKDKVNTLNALQALSNSNVKSSKLNNVMGGQATKDFVVENLDLALGNNKALKTLGYTGKVIKEGSNRGNDLLTGVQSQGDRDAMNQLAPSAPFITTGTQQPDSVAAKFFGNSANKFKFDFQTQYTKALANQKALLNKPSAVGLLAVNQSPFYNWLKDNSLDKGIL
jgi:hypothetical protein